MNIIKSSSQELLEAQPTGYDASGRVMGYRIPRRDSSFTFMGRMACCDHLRRRVGVDPTTGNLPDHQGPPANCCKHVIEQDPVHPEGIILTPYGLFICKTCMKLMERCRFKPQRDIVINCRDCVEHVARELREQNPELFIDQREIKA
jgi:hypothetical protein